MTLACVGTVQAAPTPPKPSVTEVVPGAQPGSADLRWSWTANHATCKATHLAIDYRRKGSAWRKPTGGSPNNTVNGAFDLRLSSALSSFSGTTTVGPNTSGTEPGQGGVSFEANDYDFDMAVYSQPCDDWSGWYTRSGDLRALKLSVATLALEESTNATGSFTVRLSGKPTADVTVSISSGDTSAATVSPATLTFSSTDFATPKSVTVSGDFSGESAKTATVTASPQGAGFSSGDSATVAVTVTPDSQPPTVASSTPANGGVVASASANVVVTFSEPVYADATGTAFTSSTAAQLFAVSQAKTAFNATVAVTTTGTGAYRVFTIDPSKDFGDGQVTVNIGHGTQKYYDTSGEAGASASVQFTVDTTGPAFASASASADGRDVTVTFNEALDSTSLSAAGAFTIAVDSGTAPTVDSYTVSGAKAKLRLSSGALAAQPGTVGYAMPSGQGAAKLQDAAGNAVASFSGRAVTNGSGSAPSVWSSTPAHGATVTTGSGNIVVTFDGPVYADATGTAFTASTAAQLFAIRGREAGFPANDVSDSKVTVAVTTTGAGAHRVFTVDPSKDFGDGKVTVDIGHNSQKVYAASGTVGAKATVKFTVDATAPAFSSASASADGRSVTVTFSEALDSASLPAAGAFTIAVDSGTAPTVDSYTVSGATATLKLSSRLATKSVDVSYAMPPGQGAARLQDAAGNQTASFSEETVATDVLDLAGPTFSSASASADGRNVTVTFSEALDSASLPPAGSFTIALASGTAPTVESYTVSGATATLKLSSGAVAAQLATVGYAKPSGQGAAKLQDAYGNAAATFSGGQVAHGSGGAPTVWSSSPVNGATVATASGNIVVTFDRPVYSDASGTAFTSSTAAQLLVVNAADPTLALGRRPVDKSVSVATTGAGANRVFTVNPDNDFYDGSVSVGIGRGNQKAYAASGTAGAKATVKFTVDTTSPTFSSASASADGRDVTVTFGEALDGASLPDAAAFTIGVDSGTAPTVASYTVSGATATLKLSSRLSTKSVDVSYAMPPGQGAARLQDAAGNAVASFSEETVATDVLDLVVPTVSFSPSSGTKGPSTNIVLTFSEAVYADAAGTAFTDSTAAALLELRQTDASGTAIAFAAKVATSGTDANRKFTIDPASDLPDGDVYAKIGAAFYDAATNQGAAATATFAVDATAPAFSSASASADGRDVTVTFSEALSKTDLPSASAFTIGVSSGTAPSVDSYAVAGASATLRLSARLSVAADAMVSYAMPGTEGAAKLQDAYGNAVASFSGETVATGSVLPSVSSSSPADGATVTTASGNIVVTFDRPVYADASGTAFTSSTAAQLVAIRGPTSGFPRNKQTDFDATVAVTTTGASAHRVFTIDPTEDFGEGQVTVDIGHGQKYYDSSGTAGAKASVKFTVDTTAPAFSSASASADGRSVTVTFSEGLDSASLPAAGAFTIALDAGTAPTVDSYTVSGATATLKLSSGALAAQPATVGYAMPPGKGSARLQDAHGNAVATFSGRQVTNGSGAAPSVWSSSPADGAVTSAASGNIVVTFDRPVYADATGTAFTSSTAAQLFAIRGREAGFPANDVSDFKVTVAVTTTGAGAHRVFTVDPSKDFGDGKVTVDIGHNSQKVYAASGTVGAKATVKFTVDATAPAFSSASASADGRNVTVTFSEALDSASLPAAGAFTIGVDSGTAPTVESYTVSGATATLKLSSGVLAAQPGTVGYTMPSGQGAAKLQDAAGNAVASFSGRQVLNGSGSAPTVLSSSPADGATITTASGNIVVTWDRPVYADASGTAFTSSTAARLFAIRGPTSGFPRNKQTDFEATVAVTTTGAGAHRVFTVDPTEDFGEGQVTVDIGHNSQKVYAASGTVGAKATVKFTVDTTAPAFSSASASADGGDVTVTFGEALDGSSLPPAGSFAIGVDSGTAPTVASYTVSGATATLKLSSRLSTKSVDVSYTMPPGQGAARLQDAAGNAVASFSEETVATDVLDLAGPTFSSASASADGRTVTVTFNEALDSSSLPPAGSFTIALASGTAPTVESYTVSGATATLTLSSGAVAAQLATVGYAKPSGQGAAKLQDAYGNAVATFSGGTVAHGSGGAPSVWSSSPANGGVTSAASGNIVVTFDRPVYADASGTAFTSSTAAQLFAIRGREAGFPPRRRLRISR